MKKTLLQLQYNRLTALYHKLNSRLNKHFASGRFQRFSKEQQYKLIKRLEKLRQQLNRLEQGMKLAGVTAFACLALNSTGANAQSQPSPAGNEFLVNTWTTGPQSNSSVAMDSDGDFVVVWGSYQDGEDYSGVYAQRYAADGTPQGNEFLVNTYTTGYQINPAVAMDSDGDFVVVWESLDQDGDSWGVYAQRFNASGVAQGSEFRVNTYTTGYQNNPSVAMDSDGNFVVTWGSFQDGDSHGIYAQRYAADGTAQGSEFLVNTYTTGYQDSPFVAMDSEGDFVITWVSPYQDGDQSGVYAQRYAADGTAQGNEFQVNTYTTEGQFRPSIAMDSDGDFVVTWLSDEQDGSKYGIYAQRYSSDGTAQGSEFRVNTYTTNYQFNPSVAMNSDGDFVITWISYAQDGSDNGIYAQSYAANGTAQGSEFRVNTHTTNDQSYPSIAIDDEYNCVITWQSRSQDGSDFGIYARRYALKNAPTDISLSNNSVDENVPANTTVGTLSSSDPDAGDTFTYTLVAGTGDTDNGAFSISGNELKINNSPDNEFQSSYSIRIRSTDQYGLSYEKTFIITVNGVNETPVISDQAFSVDENSSIGTSVGMIAASDPDVEETLSYAITAGNTGNVFAVNGSTGEITVAGVLDFETISVYTLTVEVSDSGTPALSASATITININDVIETGVPSAYENNSIHVYPNPSSGELLITSDVLSLEGYRMCISNILGEIVFENAYMESISLYYLPKGMYLLRLEGDGKVLVKQVVVR